MMNFMKKTSALIIAVILAVSCFAFSSSAAKNYNVKTSWGKYTTCTLTGKKDAYVYIKVYNTSAGYKNDVKMTTTSGRVIWSESKAIPNNGARNFRLGTDNKTYRVYVRTRGGSAAVNVISYSNCRVS